MYDEIPGTIAERIANIADTMVGTKTRTADFAKFLLPSPPNDPKTALQYTMSASCCALFGLAVLREAGVKHEFLSSAYKVGTAVSVLVQIAKECGVLKRYDPRQLTPYQVEIGDVFLIHPCSSKEHVIIRGQDSFVDWSSLGIRSFKEWWLAGKVWLMRF